MEEAETWREEEEEKLKLWKIGIGFFKKGTDEEEIEFFVRFMKLLTQEMVPIYLKNLKLKEKGVSFSAYQFLIIWFTLFFPMKRGYRGFLLLVTTNDFITRGMLDCYCNMSEFDWTVFLFKFVKVSLLFSNLKFNFLILRHWRPIFFLFKNIDFRSNFDIKVNDTKDKIIF